jgi:hypothetical protein
MIALAAFAFGLSRPSAYQSFSGSGGRMSPIELSFSISIEPRHLIRR